MIKFMSDIRDKTGFIARNWISVGSVYVTAGMTVRHRSKLLECVAGAVRKYALEHNYPLPEILLEPGRSIVGEAGITLYTVGVVKDVPGIRRFVSIDGGMTDNIRPALYGAVYEAALANKALQEPAEMVTIAGKACESGDLLIEDIHLPPVEKGDLLAVFSTGAYCYSMASNYNRNPRPAVIFVRNGKSRVISQGNVEDLVSLDEI